MAEVKEREVGKPQVDPFSHEYATTALLVVVLRLCSTLFVLTSLIERQGRSADRRRVSQAVQLPQLRHP